MTFIVVVFNLRQDQVPLLYLEGTVKPYLCDVHDFDGSQLSSLDMSSL